MVNKSEIVIYQTQDGNVKIDCRFEGDTFWLTQAQIAELYGRDRTVITKHLRNILDDGELEENSVCANYAHTATDGKNYNTTFYNLDMILAVGYRVKSPLGIQFRQWATAILLYLMTLPMWKRCILQF